MCQRTEHELVLYPQVRREVGLICETQGLKLLHSLLLGELFQEWLEQRVQQLSAGEPLTPLPLPNLV